MVQKPRSTVAWHTVSNASLMLLKTSSASKRQEETVSLGEFRPCGSFALLLLETWEDGTLWAATYGTSKRPILMIGSLYLLDCQIDH